jgi:hypothetical protein
MKHVVLLGLAMLSVMSCSQPSAENKVGTFIQESIKKSLNHPESYLAIETVVDSAFAPFDDPVFYEKTLEISKMTLESLDYVRKAQEASRDSKSKGHVHMSDSAKAISNLYNRKVDSLSAKIQEKGRKLMDMMGTEYRFIGFKVTHVYSVEDDGENATIRKRIFIMDDKLTKSLAEYDASSKEYIMVQTMYRMWEEETLLTQEK